MEVMIKNARLSYPHIFTASAFAPGQEAKFSASFLIEANDPQLALLKAAMLEAAEAKWPGKGKKMMDSFDTRNKAVKDGNKARPDDSTYEDMIVISALNKSRPLVVDRRKQPLTEEDGVIYAGCRVNAKIRFFAYDNVSKGVSASLLGVQFVGDDTPFGGAAIAKVDDFDELDDAEDL
jgi:hypothetical protein